MNTSESFTTDTLIRRDNEDEDNEARANFSASSYITDRGMKWLVTHTHTHTHTDTHKTTIVGKTNRGREDETWKANDQAVCFKTLTGGRKMAAEQQKSFCLFVVLHSTVCAIFHWCVWDAWWPSNVFNLSVTPCDCVSVRGRADIRSHFDFMAPLFLSPVVSVWFIQWQMQSRWIGLACNDLSCRWERVERKVKGRKKKEWEWGHNTISGEVWGGLKLFFFFHLRWFD